jgi:hypothetical protein
MPRLIFLSSALVGGISFLAISCNLSRVRLSEAYDPVVPGADCEPHAIQTAIDRTESNVTGFAVILAIIDLNKGLFPYEGLDGRKIDAVLPEVGFALFIVPLIHSYLIVHTIKSEVNENKLVTGWL